MPTLMYAWQYIDLYTFLLLFYALYKSTGISYIVWRCVSPPPSPALFPAGSQYFTKIGQLSVSKTKWFLFVIFFFKVSSVRGELPRLRLQTWCDKSRLSNYRRLRGDIKITKTGISAHVWSPGVTKPGCREPHNQTLQLPVPESPSWSTYKPIDRGAAENDAI